MKVKICGIRSLEQARAIAQMGATALGYICVEKSPRYVTTAQIAAIVSAIAPEFPQLDHFGVFANAPVADIVDTVRQSGLSVVQLHGDEPVSVCEQLRAQLTQELPLPPRIIKAFRIRAAADLQAAQHYVSVVDGLLLDAYHPEQLGGTGKTLDWESLRQFSPEVPWFLAGGLRPDNVTQALTELSPDGIDLSSGVEHSPGDKDLEKVRALFEALSAIAAH